jgi:hypothetical protein
MFDDTTVPTVYGLLPRIRELVIKECIDIIHVHQVNYIFKIVH